MDHLYAVNPKEIYRYLKGQDLLFWLINIYLFLEYVRPQAIYPSIDVLPFTQLVLLIALGIFLLKNKGELVQNSINKLLSIFFLVVVLSSIFALNPSVAFDKMPEFVAWLIIYFLIINIVNTEKRFFVFMLAFLLYSFKMAQFSFRGWASMGFGYSNWGTGGGPGWFSNSGEFGIQMCVFFPLAFYFFLALRGHWPRWKQGIFILFPVFAVSGAISSSSRGALLGIAAVAAWMVLKSRYRVKGGLVLGLVVALVLAVLPPEQKARFEMAGHENDRTSQTRMERWDKGLEMAARYPVLGVGFANWGVADRALFNGDGALSHNIFIECKSELGNAGLVVFVFLIVFTFVNNYQTRKIVSTNERDNRFLLYMAHGLDGALIGYLVSGFFVTVMYYPYFWINLALTVSLNSVAKKMMKNKKEKNDADISASKIDGLRSGGAIR